MPNYKKSFNFRNGVQVDDDNFIVNPNGLVGIGTSVPTEFLDVRGTAKVVGIATIKNTFIEEGAIVSGVATIGQIEVGITSILPSGIVTATSTSGVITYFGDGANLLNLPTSQWIDVNPGLGFSSIYSAGYVGIATELPYNALQIGGTADDEYSPGVGINSTGDIKATGIITTRQLSFEGPEARITGVTSIIDSTALPLLTVTQLQSGVDALKVDGSIDANGRIVGAAVSNVIPFLYATYGDLPSPVTYHGAFAHVHESGKALYAHAGNWFELVNKEADARIGTGTEGFNLGSGNVVILNASEIKSGFSTIGVSTVTDVLHVGTGGTILANNGKFIGIGTVIPTSDLQIRKPSGVAKIEIVSEGDSSVLSIGQSVGVGASSAAMKFGVADKTLDIVNNDTGDFNLVLHGGPAGLSTGNFNFVNGQSNGDMMTLTYQGDLGLGVVNPNHKLHVVGSSTVTGNAFVGGNFSIGGSIDAGTFNLPNVIASKINNAGINTFGKIYVNSSIGAGTSVGIGTDDPIVDLDAQAKTGLIGRLGINTSNEYTSNAVSGALVVGGQANFGAVGVGTTSIAYLYEQNTNETFACYEAAGFFNTQVRVYNSGVICDENSLLGVGTHVPLAAVDFSKAGSGPGPGLSSARAMRTPQATTAQRAGVTTQTGSIIYNTDAGEHQAYCDDEWVGFANQTGIVTAANGFTSGTGTPVQISVVGSTLTFTVAGIGSTSLTLS